jgi:signal transduction histidine kinase
MTTSDRSWRDWADRRGPLLAEVAVLVALAVVDTVVAVRAGGADGFPGQMAVSVTGGLGTVAAVLAVLRRRLPDRVAILTISVAAASFLGSAASALAGSVGAPAPPSWAGAETAGLALLVGSSCRRLSSRAAIGVATSGGLAMVLAPVARNGPDSTLALLAAPAALLWGGALAVGLMLRDGDQRRAAELTAARQRVRRHERLLMARELHDLVAHHITGVVVRAQAARVVAARQREGPGDEVFAEIERAGAGALAATRQMVAVLRTGEDTIAAEPAGIVDVVRRAVEDEDGVSLTMSGALEGLPLTAESVQSVRWMLMEALTNVRRHAPRAGDVQVQLALGQGDEQDWLEVNVVNDAVTASPGPVRPGYGLLGMTERLTAVGGSLTAGPDPDGRWRVSARLPVATHRSGRNDPSEVVGPKAALSTHLGEAQT